MKTPKNMVLTESKKLHTPKSGAIAKRKSNGVTPKSNKKVTMNEFKGTINAIKEFATNEDLVTPKKNKGAKKGGVSPEMELGLKIEALIEKGVASKSPTAGKGAQTPNQKNKSPKQEGKGVFTPGKGKQPNKASPKGTPGKGKQSNKASPKGTPGAQIIKGAATPKQKGTPTLPSVSAVTPKQKGTSASVVAVTPQQKGTPKQKETPAMSAVTPKQKGTPAVVAADTPQQKGMPKQKGTPALSAVSAVTPKQKRIPAAVAVVTPQQKGTPKPQLPKGTPAAFPKQPPLANKSPENGKKKKKNKESAISGLLPVVQEVHVSPVKKQKLDTTKLVTDKGNKKVTNVEKTVKKKAVPNLLVKSKVLNALKALYKSKENRAKNKKDLLSGEAQPILMQINCVKTPVTPNRFLRIILPNKTVCTSPEICLIVGDLKGKKQDHEAAIDHYTELLKANNVTCISEILPLRQISTEYGQYEQKKKLASRFDVFLVEGKITHRALPILGKPFYVQNKVPIPIPLDRDVPKKIDQVLRKAVIHLKGKGNCFSTQIGTTDLSPNDVADNIVALASGIDTSFPGGWKNVRSLYVNYKGGKMLPIFVSLISRDDVPDPIVESTTRKRKPVVDELSTIPGATAIVYPSGQVRIRKRKAEDDGEDKEETDEAEISGDELGDDVNTEGISDEEMSDEGDSDDEEAAADESDEAATESESEDENEAAPQPSSFNQVNAAMEDSDSEEDDDEDEDVEEEEEGEEESSDDEEQGEEESSDDEEQGSDEDGEGPAEEKKLKELEEKYTQDLLKKYETEKQKQGGPKKGFKGKQQFEEKGLQNKGRFNKQAGKDGHNKKPWQNRNEKGSPQGNKPWQNRNERGMQQGGNKPWQNKNDKGMQQQGGGNKPWQNRNRNDAQGGKPWQNKNKQSPLGKGHGKTNFKPNQRQSPHQQNNKRGQFNKNRNQAQNKQQG